MLMYSSIQCYRSGLPIVSFFCVTSNVLAPILAEAAADSVPACPPPITITS